MRIEERSDGLPIHYGPSWSLAQLALDAISGCRGLGAPIEYVEKLEDRWKELVCVPGGSHFPSRSSSSSK